MPFVGVFGRTGDGITAIALSFAIAGIAVGLLLITVALVGPRWPPARALLSPIHLSIVGGQLLDGSTTWVGVMNPFDLDIPDFQEQVFVSALILDHFGGFAFFAIKGVLALLIVATVEFALQRTRSQREWVATRLVQLALVVITFIPVWNNLTNFFALP